MFVLSVCTFCLLTPSTSALLHAHFMILCWFKPLSDVVTRSQTLPWVFVNWLAQQPFACSQPKDTVGHHCPATAQSVWRPFVSHTASDCAHLLQSASSACSCSGLGLCTSSAVLTARNAASICLSFSASSLASLLACR